MSISTGNCALFGSSHRGLSMIAVGYAFGLADRSPVGKANCRGAHHVAWLRSAPFVPAPGMLSRSRCARIR